MNEDLQAQSDTEHARCWRQLPWWVNGTLSSDEASRIEKHITACRECTVELELQRALQAQLRDGDPVLMAPQSAWQSMAARLDNEDEALVRGHFKLASGTGVWRWAVAAQALLIIGLTTAVWQQAQSPDVAAAQTDALLQPRYETLTSSSEVAPEGVVRVVFRQDVTLAAVNALLRELSTQIVAGPTEAGVYMLSMPSPTVNGSSDQAAVLLKSLRSDARVIFAEPGEYR